MANYMRIFFLSAQAMQQHQLDRDILSERPFANVAIIEDPSTGTTMVEHIPPDYAQNPPSTLDWIRQRLAANQEHLVNAYVYEKYPGAMHVIDFRGTSRFVMMMNCLTANAPLQMKQRLGLINDDGDEHMKYAETAIEHDLRRDSRTREAFLAQWDSPLNILNLQGWQFMLPEDIDYLIKVYQSGSFVDDGYLIDLCRDELDELAHAHATVPYDVVVAIDEGMA